MIGKLLPEEIEDLLHKQLVGHLGCHYEGVTYVVPISYAYDGKYIYCHSYEGQKIKIMRKNPRICFQVDEMKDMGNWKSVIAWGDFEELVDKREVNDAFVILLERRLPIISSITTHLGKAWPFSVENGKELNKIPGVVFRISIQEKTGKFERTSVSPLLMFN